MVRTITWLYGYKPSGDKHERYLAVHLRIPGWVHPNNRKPKM